MKDAKKEFAAPWGRALKCASFGVGALVVSISFWSAWDGKSPWPLLLPAGLLLAVPFIVTGYAVTDTHLIIKRPLWDTRFPLEGLESVEIDPHALKRTIRLCGNGGLFSITGLYRNKRLGNFRGFINDLNRMVVVRLARRTLVVSPHDPEAFVREMRKNVCSSKGLQSRL